VTTARVAVVGAGALGSRHLQALARVDHPMAVDVVDPLPAALEIAAARLREAGGLRSGTLRWLREMDSREPAIDIAIVATNSQERLTAVRSLAAGGCRAMILEKVLFPRLSDYDEAERLLRDASIAAWVNVPRRSYPRAAALKAQLAEASLNYCVEGIGWGLACNVIHHLDELEYLTGSPLASLDTSGLRPGSVASKRAGYIEFLGTLRGRTDRGDTFEATCTAGDPGERLVRIASASRTFAISQVRQELSVRNGSIVRSEPYPIPLQSVATAEHVTALLAGRSPGLPSFSAAAAAHRTMISAFLDHLRRTGPLADPDECPIT
jgi:predicted dehydrogenase